MKRNEGDGSVPGRGDGYEENRRERVDRIIAEYLRAVDARESFSWSSCFEANLDLKEELDAFLADEQYLRGVHQDVAEALAAEHAIRASDLTTLEAGSRFARYEIAAILGRGGMGIVYRARDTALGRSVALKTLAGGALASERELRRFRLEAEAVATLDHSNIIPVYDVGEIGGRAYFTMKLVEGGDLASRSSPRCGGARAVASLMAKVARAIQHAHERGVLHRDLKPSNVLIDTSGEPLVSDFGLAKLLEGDPSVTQSGAVVGTPGYMAPEQASGARGQVTTLTDVWGLGAVLYHVLVGRPPFEGHSALEILQRVAESEPTPPSRLRSDVPRDLETICLKCLRKRPAQRFESAAALALDLERFARGEPIGARPQTGLERVARRIRRHRVLVGAAMIVFTVLVTSLAVVWVAQRDTESALERTRRALAESRLDRGLSRLEDGDRTGMLDLLEAVQAADGLPELRGAARAAWASAAARLEGRLVDRFGPLRDAVRRRLDETLGEFTADGRNLDEPFAWAHHDLVQFWDLSSGEAVGPTFELPSRISSRDSSTVVGRFAVVTALGELIVWDASRAQPLFRSTVLGGMAATELRFSPDGERIAIASGPNGAAAALGAEVRDGRDGELSFRVSRDARVVRVAFPRDGAKFATLDASGTIRVWNAHSGDLESEASSHPTATRLTYDPLGSRIFSASPNGRILREADRLEQEDGLTTMSFSGSGRLAATGDRVGVVRVWDTVRGDEERIWSVLLAAPGSRDVPIHDVVFRSDERYLAASASDGSVRVWNAATWREVWLNLRGEPPIELLRFTRDGSLLVQDAHGEVLRWRPEPTSLESRRVPHTGVVGAVAFDASGRNLAAATIQTVSIHDLATGELVATRSARAPVLDVAFAEDALVVALDDGSVERWSGPSFDVQRARHACFPGGIRPTRVALSRDGERIVSLGGDVLSIRGTRDGGVEAQLSSDSTPALVGVRSLCFDARAERILMVLEDRTLRIWRPGDRKLESFVLTGKPIDGLVPGRDDRVLVTAVENEARLRLASFRHVDSGFPVRFVGRVHDLAVHPDGSWLAAGTSDALVFSRLPSWMHAAPSRAPERTWLSIGLRRDSSGDTRLLPWSHWRALREDLGPGSASTPEASSLQGAIPRVRALPRRDPGIHESVAIPVRFGALCNARTQDFGFGDSTLDEFPFGSVELGGFRFDLPHGPNAWSGDRVHGAGRRIFKAAVGVRGATRAHLLLNTLWGQTGPESLASIRFHGPHSVLHEKPLVGDDDVRDCVGEVWTSRINGLSTENVYLSADGRARVDRVTVDLPSVFREQALCYVELVDDGRSELQRLLLSGIAVEGRLDFPREWLVAGPYRWGGDCSGSPDTLLQDHLGGEDSFSPRVGRALPASPALQVPGGVELAVTEGDTLDFRVHFGERGRSRGLIAYAWTCVEFHGREPTRYLLGFASDDGIDLCLNGARVVTRLACRPAGQPGSIQEQVPIVLNPGSNRIRMKVSQANFAWLARIHIADATGEPVTPDRITWPDPSRIASMGFPHAPASVSRTIRSLSREGAASGSPDAEVLLRISDARVSVRGTEWIPAGWSASSDGSPDITIRERGRELHYVAGRGETLIRYRVRRRSEAERAEAADALRSVEFRTPDAIHGEFGPRDQERRFSTTVDPIR